MSYDADRETRDEVTEHLDFSSRAIAVLGSLLRPMLIVLSTLATMSGLWDFAGVDLANGINETIKVVMVVLVSLAIIWAMVFAIDAMLDRRRRFVGRALGAVAYVLFASWSVGFGFGFFWKTIAAEEFTRDQFQAAGDLVLLSVSQNLEQLKSAAQQARIASNASQEAAEYELANGGSCDNNTDSVIGDGPLRKARLDYARRALQIADGIDSQWVLPLQTESNEIAWRFEALLTGRGVLATDVEPIVPGMPTAKDQAELDELIAARDSVEERGVHYKKAIDRARLFGRKSEGLQSTFQQMRVDQLRALVREMTERGERPKEAFCEDLKLAGNLEAAAALIERIEPAPPIEWKFREGREATVFAFQKLFQNVFWSLGDAGREILKAISFGVSFVFDTDATWLNEEQGRNPELVSLFKMNMKDFMAFFVAIAVDMALVFVSIISRSPDMGDQRPPKKWSGPRNGSTLDGPSADDLSRKSPAELKAEAGRREAQSTALGVLNRADKTYRERIENRDNSAGIAIVAAQTKNIVSDASTLMGSESKARKFLSDTMKHFHHLDGRLYIVFIYRPGQERSTEDFQRENFIIAHSLHPGHNAVVENKNIIERMKSELRDSGAIGPEENVTIRILDPLPDMRNAISFAGIDTQAIEPPPAFDSHPDPFVAGKNDRPPPVEPIRDPVDDPQPSPFDDSKSTPGQEKQEKQEGFDYGTAFGQFSSSGNGGRAAKSEHRQPPSQTVLPVEEGESGAHYMTPHPASREVLPGSNQTIEEQVIPAGTVSEKGRSILGRLSSSLPGRLSSLFRIKRE